MNDIATVCLSWHNDMSSNKGDTGVCLQTFASCSYIVDGNVFTASIQKQISRPSFNQRFTWLGHEWGNKVNDDDWSVLPR